MQQGPAVPQYSARPARVRKAGEVVAPMFPSQRTYPLVPSPNGPARPLVAEAPQRGGRAGGGKGWIRTARGTRVYVPQAADFGVADLRDVAGRTVAPAGRDRGRGKDLRTWRDAAPPRRLNGGNRPARVDPAYDLTVPTRAELGREAADEVSANPPATCPWHQTGRVCPPQPPRD